MSDTSTSEPTTGALSRSPRPINRSALPDELFYALSSQGQAIAIRTAKPAKTADGKQLSPAQKATLLRALGAHPWAHISSDCRSEFILCGLGFMQHVGAEPASRPTARFRLTEKGLARAEALKAAAAG